MSLFNKLKKGVTDAGNVAKSTVESNRLKAQISKHQTDIHSLYFEIGKKVFSAASSEQPVNVQLVEEEINLIQENLTSIKQLEINIKAIWNEKECLCGKLVPLDAKFCPACGHKFTAKPVSTPVDSKEVEGTEQQETMILLPKAEPVEKKRSLNKRTLRQNLLSLFMESAQTVMLNLRTGQSFAANAEI